MNHHGRSAIALAVALGFLGISWFVGHRPAEWEYVFFMFVVFSSALQDAIDGMNWRLEKVTQLLEESADKIEDLNRELVKSTFVAPEPPKLEPFDAQKFRAERLREVADALRGHSWWDMSVVTTPLQRLFAYVADRPAFIRWISND